MKKLPVLLSLIFVVSMLLAACAGGDTNANGTGVLETPGVTDNLEPTPDLGGSELVDPTATVAGDTGMGAVEPTATLAADGAVEATATVAPEAGAVGDMTATPEAEAQVPATGAEAEECTPNRLTKLLDFEVRDQAGDEIGEVDGLVVLRDTTATTAADTTTFTAGSAPVVGYVIVDFDDADTLGNQDVLVPFTAFQGLTMDLPLEDCAFVTNYDPAIFSTEAGSPALIENDMWSDFTVDTWNTDINSFWTSQGFEVPTTNASGAQLGAPVIFRDTFDDIDVQNANGEDLGEVEDFVLDPQSGEISYALLAAGGFLGLGEKIVPVPMTSVFWGNTDDDADDLGEMVINIADDAWENVPSFDSVDDIDFNTEGWDTDITTFWETQMAPATE